MRINPINTGIALGLFLALWHACWAGLVAIGAAQPLVDFVLWAHFMKLPVQIEPFAITRAFVLVGLNFFVGLVGGWVLGLVWNGLHPAKE